MISSLRGTVLSVTGGNAVLEVGGVGYAVQLTPDHALGLHVGETAFVRTSMIVREDSLSLFGFSDDERLGVFELLLGVTGVGPKSAMGVLAALSPGQIARAVDEDDDAVFRKVSGIGPKTAKLIVLSLTGKLVADRAVQPAASARSASPLGDSVLVALMGLGWPERVAAEVIAEIIADHAADERDSVQALLRLALARLGPGRQPARSTS